MIDSTHQIINSTNTVSTDQIIDLDIKKALELINAVKHKANKVTVEELESLLIQYIIANTEGGSSKEKEEIQGQISQVLNTYEKDMNQANDLIAKLSSMKGNPNLKDLSYLQNLIASLQQDLPTGNMSNLFQY